MFSLLLQLRREECILALWLSVATSHGSFHPSELLFSPPQKEENVTYWLGLWPGDSEQMFVKKAHCGLERTVPTL